MMNEKVQIGGGVYLHSKKIGILFTSILFILIICVNKEKVFLSFFSTLTNTIDILSWMYLCTHIDRLIDLLVCGDGK